MKEYIRTVGPYANLFRDTKNGIAWIEDGNTGLGFSTARTTRLQLKNAGVQVV